MYKLIVVGSARGVRQGENEKGEHAVEHRERTRNISSIKYIYSLYIYMKYNVYVAYFPASIRRTTTTTTTTRLALVLWLWLVY